LDNIDSITITYYPLACLAIVRTQQRLKHLSTLAIPIVPRPEMAPNAEVQRIARLNVFASEMVPI
jgi:hypothetical protein